MRVLDGNAALTTDFSNVPNSLPQPVVLSGQLLTVMSQERHCMKGSLELRLPFADGRIVKPRRLQTPQKLLRETLSGRIKVFVSLRREEQVRQKFINLRILPMPFGLLCLFER